MGVSNREGRRKETKLEAGLSACWVFTMSGILWDPSQQPDLVESLSTFATSALALSLALPMFLVDMACCLVLSICSLLSAILTPVLELLGQGGALILAATGMEDSWSGSLPTGIRNAPAEFLKADGNADRRALDHHLPLLPGLRHSSAPSGGSPLPRLCLRRHVSAWPLPWAFGLQAQPC